MICKAVEVIFRVQWGQETCLGVPGGRLGGPGGTRGSRGASWGSHGAIGLVSWVSWLFMRHICLYTGVQIFSAYGRAGSPEVVQEALADLKREKLEISHKCIFITKKEKLEISHKCIFTTGRCWGAEEKRPCWRNGCCRLRFSFVHLNHAAH